MAVGGSMRRTGRNGWIRTFVVVLVLLAFLGACSSPVDRSDALVTSTSRAASTAPTTTSTTTVATTAAVGEPTTTVPAPSVRDRLAVLAVDDRPRPNGVYRREDWPHWSDTDGNGCDARQDALVAWSLVPATVNRSGGCRVVVGSWISPYDGKRSNNPSDFDIDHLVPLENAFESGGWAWTASQRRSYANDVRGLVVSSASSNRSKGSRTPDQWRPTDRSSWCAYADGWVSVKQRWSLTVTTGERDALGQMLDTCTPAGPVWPGRG